MLKLEKDRVFLFFPRHLFLTGVVELGRFWVFKLVFFYVLFCLSLLFCEFWHDVFLSCCFLWQVDSSHIRVPFQSALTSWHFKKKMGVLMSVVMTTFTVLPAKCWSMFGRDLRVRVSWVHIGSDHLTQSGTPMASLRHPQHPCLEYCQPRDWGRNSAQLGLASEVGLGMGWWSQRLDRWFSCVAHLLKRYSMLKL